MTPQKNRPDFTKTCKAKKANQKPGRQKPKFMCTTITFFLRYEYIQIKFKKYDGGVCDVIKKI